MEENPETPQKQTNGYGKRPVWHWVVIYLVLAAIVYGLVYYFIIHKSGGTGKSIY